MNDIMNMSIPQLEYILEGISNNNKKQDEALNGESKGPQKTHEGQSALSFIMANQGTVDTGL